MSSPQRSRLVTTTTPPAAAPTAAPNDDDDDSDGGEAAVEDCFDFDSIFDELGECGRYQTIVYGCMCVAILLYGQVTLTYVFTAGDLNYRCAISAADYDAANSSTVEVFQPEWLAKVMPISQQTGLPTKCQRYASVNGTATQSLVGCDAYVYQTAENNLLRQFHLQCSANDWKRTLVGSANNAALFVGLPAVGFLSDRYGRKRLFIWGLFGCSVAGLLKSCADRYELFVALEMLDALLGAGTFMGAYVLAMELVGPGRRTLSGVLVNCCYTIGVMLLGVWASTVADYRVWLRLCYAPGILVLAYIWVIPESTRWLFCVNRRSEGAHNIRRAARVNGCTLSDRFEKRLRAYCDREPSRFATPAQGTTKQFWRSRVLVGRTVSCCAVWFVHAFVTYGLTLNSVDLAAGRPDADKHTQFVLMCGIEIPACIFTYFTMDLLGRRLSLGGLLLLAAGACAGMLTLDGGGGAAFALFLLGKFAITASFSVLYVYTAEIFPTPLRSGLMSSCSMVGRLGAMLAAQTPLLARYAAAGPLVLYGGSAVLTAGAVWMWFPETLGARLPDTVAEAENVGREGKCRPLGVTEEGE